jgi:hypothetical protein
METKHTPGPWRIDEAFKGGRVAIRAGDAETVAFFNPLRDFNATDHANARLIAAAPDLLAALESAVYRAQLQHMADPANVRFDTDPLITQMRAAIARAKGEA